LVSVVKVAKLLSKWLKTAEKQPKTAILAQKRPESTFLVNIFSNSFPNFYVVHWKKKKS
jgi:hypothetical protein